MFIDDETKDQPLHNVNGVSMHNNVIVHDIDAISI